MKIIEKNNKIKCKCGCVMEYEKSDIHKRGIRKKKPNIFYS